MVRRGFKTTVIATVIAMMLSPNFSALAQTGKSNTLGSWKLENNAWVFLDGEGKQVKGWVVYNQEWYYMNPENGQLKMGWLQLDGKWYFLSTEAGAMQGRLLIGWQWIDGYCYYFYGNDDSRYGELLVNGRTPDGYYVNQSGHWLQGEGGEAVYEAGRGLSSAASEQQVAGASRALPGQVLEASRAIAAPGGGSFGGGGGGGSTGGGGTTASVSTPAAGTTGSATGNAAAGSSATAATGGSTAGATGTVSEATGTAGESATAGASTGAEANANASTEAESNASVSTGETEGTANPSTEGTGTNAGNAGTGASTGTENTGAETGGNAGENTGAETGGNAEENTGAETGGNAGENTGAETGSNAGENPGTENNGSTENPDTTVSPENPKRPETSETTEEPKKPETSENVEEPKESEKPAEEDKKEEEGLKDWPAKYELKYDKEKKYFVLSLDEGDKRQELKTFLLLEKTVSVNGKEYEEGDAKFNLLKEVNTYCLDLIGNEKERGYLNAFSFSKSAFHEGDNVVEIRPEGYKPVTIHINVTKEELQDGKLSLQKPDTLEHEVLDKVNPGKYNVKLVLFRKLSQNQRDYLLGLDEVIVDNIHYKKIKPVYFKDIAMKGNPVFFTLEEVKDVALNLSYYPKEAGEHKIALRKDGYEDLVFSYTQAEAKTAP